MSKYRPDVPNGDNITIAQLLDMRSGLKSYTVLESFNRTLDDDPSRAWDPEELAAIGLAEPVSFAPGTSWEYSNTNTVLAGLIVEQITGMPLADVFADRIFEPLEMHDTLLPAVDDATIPEPHPHGYMFGTNVSTLTPEGAVLPEAERAQGARRDAPARRLHRPQPVVGVGGRGGNLNRRRPGHLRRGARGRRTAQ